MKNLESIGIDTSRPMAVSVEPTDAFKDYAIAAVTADTREKAESLAREVPPLNDMLGFAAALPVRDKAKVEQLLMMAQAILGGGGAPAVEAVGDGQVTVLPGVGAYCLTDQWAVLGNSDKLVKETAARFAAPREVRYGSPACPAFDANEAVAQFFTGRSFTLLRQVLEAVAAKKPLLKPVMEQQMKEMEAILAAGDSDDPALLTLTITAERVELRGRVDTATHKGLLEQSGVPLPMELVRQLPENTELLLALSLTQNIKTQLSNSVKQAAASLPPDAPDRQKKGLQQASTYADQVMGALGAQFVLGVAGTTANGLPALYALVESNNPILPQLLMGLGRHNARGGGRRSGAESEPPPPVGAGGLCRDGGQGLRGQHRP